MKTFNINNHVSVKLTEAGKKQWREYHIQLMRYGNCPIDTELKLDENGYYKGELWLIMSIWGSELYNGGDLMFETEIILHDED